MDTVPWYGFCASDGGSLGFEDAARLYVRSGGEARYLGPLISYFRNTPVSELRQSHLEQCAKSLFPTQSAETQIRQLFVPMIAILHVLQERGLCRETHFTRPVARQAFPRIPTDQEIKTFLSNANSRTTLRIAKFMLGTGARSNEVAGLCWQNVDLNSSTILLGISHKMREVPLPQDIAYTLSRIQKSDGAVFLRSGDRPYKTHSAGAFAKAFRNVCARANLSDISPKVLRTVWARRHWSVHHDLQGLMELGGWKDERMLLRLLVPAPASFNTLPLAGRTIANYHAP